MKTKVTNKLGLPEAFVRAVQNDPYDPDDGGQKSDYTITGLLKPARMAQLAKTAEVTEDASERLYSLQGQLIHGMLERSKEELEAEGFVVEKRFYKTYLVNGQPFIVSAKVDVFDPVQGRLSDYKYTSVSSAKHGLKDEHYWQINFQVELLREAGFQVEKADATILMRDWSAERTFEGYPTSPCMLHHVSLASSADIDAFIVERIMAHESAKEVLPTCTAEERWNRPTFAVMKDEKAIKATRVFDTKIEAMSFVKEKSGILVERPGKSIRCLRYCPVRFVCEQAKEETPVVVLDDNGLTEIK